jgi:hypothetical protein
LFAAAVAAVASAAPANAQWSQGVTAPSMQTLPSAAYPYPTARPTAGSPPVDPQFPGPNISARLPLTNGPQSHFTPDQYRRTALHQPPYTADSIGAAALAASKEPLLNPAVTSHKSGFFQKLSLSVGYINRGDSADFGIIETKFFTTVALPAPTKQHPLLITTGYNDRLFDGPRGVELPSRVFDAYLELMWVPRINDNWTAIVAVSPGIYSDAENIDDDAFRITGKGLLKWQLTAPQWQVLFGVLYLDRNDVAVLPAGGVIWTPHDDFRLDLLFPSPKVARRFGFEPGHSEDWYYLAGEFGGDMWSVERKGVRERITMRDFRVFVGLEKKYNGGAGFRMEAGYVFGRIVEFDLGDPDLEVSPAALVRAVITR